MIMADVLMWFLLILGLLLVYVSHWLVTVALFPRFVARTRAHYRQPGRLTLIGLVTAGPLFGLALLLLKMNNPAVRLLGGFFLSIVVLLGLGGSAGLSQKVGLGLPSPLDAQQPWRAVLRGGGALVLTFLLPLFGWFALTIWTLVSGFAAAIQSFKPESAETATDKIITSSPVAVSAPSGLATAKEMHG